MDKRRAGRIARAAEEYEKRFSKMSNNKGAFWAGDFNEVRNMAGNDVWEMISVSLTAGFMIGYRCAKAEARKAQQQ